MKYENDGRQIEFTPIVTGLSHHIYTYTVDFNGNQHDRGYVILGTKLVEEEEDGPRAYFHLFIAESEETYITESPFLFPTPESLLEDMIPDLVSATGSNEYLSSFLTAVEYMGASDD